MSLRKHSSFFFSKLEFTSILLAETLPENQFFNSLSEYLEHRNILGVLFFSVCLLWAKVIPDPISLSA